MSRSLSRTDQDAPAIARPLCPNHSVGAGVPQQPPHLPDGAHQDTMGRGYYDSSGIDLMGPDPPPGTLGIRPLPPPSTDSQTTSPTVPPIHAPRSKGKRCSGADPQSPLPRPDDDAACLERLSLLADQPPPKDELGSASGDAHAPTPPAAAAAQAETSKSSSIDILQNDRTHSIGKPPSAGSRRRSTGTSTGSQRSRADQIDDESEKPSDLLRQEEIFNEFVAEIRRKGIARETKSESEGENVKLSSRQLLDQSDSGKTISNYREYQLELFRKAKEKNSIVVLDTGAGKTMIAILLLRHIIENNMEDRVRGGKRKIAFFLVPSAPLVFQQAKTIQTNLPYTVQALCGALVTEGWDKDKWNETFSSHEIVVCTGEILNQCLRHGFIQIENIGLIIFDEVHHAKLNHVYAEIARNHYHRVSPSERPHLFGMTASPVDNSSLDMDDAIHELQHLMDSRIITTSDPDLLKHAFARPKEINVHYSPFSEGLASVRSDCGAKLAGFLTGMPEYKKLLATSGRITAELGHWAGNVFWKYTIDAELQHRIERRINKAHPGDVELLDSVQQNLVKARDLVKRYDFGAPEARIPSVSPKVLELLKTLNVFNTAKNDRCLVFVDMKLTAQILYAMFSHSSFAPFFLKPGMLIGGSATQNMSLSGLRQSVNGQFLSILNFRKGILNCLFATSVAEEGLDIPDCNYVVRFDLYKTMIQYVQSRGRARHRKSKYFHFIEANNFEHQKLRDIVKHQEEMMRLLCRALPEDNQISSRELGGPPPDNKVIWQNPKTNATITQQSAISLIYLLGTYFPTTDPEGPKATFVTHQIGGQYQCELYMPVGKPIRGALAPSKMMAKQYAASKACHKFFRMGYFDDHLVPTLEQGNQLQTSDKLALDANRTERYVRRAKPHQWRASPDGSLPDKLYMTVLDISGTMPRPHKPFCLLTRTPVPGALPPFNLYLDDGELRETDIRPDARAIDVTTREIEMFTEYTFRLLQDVFAKTYRVDSTKLSYWVVPLTRSVPKGESARQYFDMGSLEEVYTKDQRWSWKAGMPSEELVNRYMIDQWDKRRRGFSVRVQPDLKPDDPMPAEFGLKHKTKKTILEYSVSLWKASREARENLWDRNQPVLRMSLLLHRIQTFIPPKKRDLKANPNIVLCPEPFRISRLRPEHVVFAMMFPAMIYKIEEYMVSWEGIQNVNLDITDLKLALAAFTVDLAASADSENDTTVLDDEQRLNVIRTMGPSYERLEFLGDTFLKMAVTIELFCASINQRESEFQLHENRKLLVCNSNMFTTAKERGIAQFGRTAMFSRRSWYPHGIELLEGKQTESEDPISRISDKGVADFCEALIGACFLQYYQSTSWTPEDWDAAVKAVTVTTLNKVSGDLHASKQTPLRAHLSLTVADYMKMYRVPDWATAPPTEQMKRLGEAIARIDGYEFKNLRILQSAFTHQTTVLSGGHSVPSYQLLEFLGDSLLDLVCVEWLIDMFPDQGPEWMTKHKMAVVSNQFFSMLSVRLGFSKLMNFTSTAMAHAIEVYESQVSLAMAEAAAAKAGGESDSSDFWTKVADAPKFLSDTVEAYTGALFLDSGFDFGQVRRFFQTHILPYFGNISRYDTFASKHPVTALQRLLDHNFGCARTILRHAPVPGPPIPNTLDPETGREKIKELTVAAVVTHETVVASFVASTPRLARTGGARAAVGLLEKMERDEFASVYGCDCGSREWHDIFM